MPFLETDEATPGLRVPTGVAPPNTDRPGFQDVLTAAARSENTVVSLARRLLEERYPTEPDHNPLDLIQATKFEERHFERFTASQSAAETQSIMRRIEEEEADSKTLDAGGLLGHVAQFGAAILDPTIALPAGTIYRTARGGVALGRSAASVAAAAAGQAGLQEAILQGTHETRSLLQSTTAVGSATLLGGLIGAGAARLLSRSERVGLIEALDRERAAMDAHAGGGRVSEPPAQTRPDEAANPDFPWSGGIRGVEESAPTAPPLVHEPALAQAAGAAAADARKLELERHGLEFSDRLSPTRRTLSAESIEARRVMADLAETPYRFKENVEGVATTQGGALDRLARTEINGTRVAVADELDRLWRDMRFGGKQAPWFARARDSLGVLDGGGLPGYAQFKAMISQALRENDQHVIPQVAEAARFIRASVFEPWKQRAIAAGLLPEGVGVKTADSYIQRVYNREMIRAQRPEFVNQVTSWLKSDQDTKAAAKQRIEFAGAQLASWQGQIKRLEGRLGRMEDRGRNLVARLDERAMEVARGESRSDALSDRTVSLTEELGQLDEFVEAMRGELRDPQLLAELENLERDAAALRARDRPMTEAQLRKIEEEEARSVLTGTTRMAAEMLVGRRAWPKAPSFVSWLVANGGIMDPGGDVQAIMGGARVRPGLLNSRNGLTLDQLAEKIAEAAPGHFPHRDIPGGGLPAHREVLEWIDEALRGREPGWWIDVMSAEDRQKLDAAKLAGLLDEALNRAGVEVKSMADVGRLLRDERRTGVTLADLDKVVSEMEAAGEAIPVAVRRAAADDQVIAGRESIAQLRAVVDQAVSARDARTQRLRVAEARGEEAAYAERQSRGRLRIIEDQLSRADLKHELVVDAIGSAQRHHDDLRAKLEAEIAAWEGKSVADAKGALKAREKYAAEKGRAADAPRLTSADNAIDLAVKRIVHSDRDLGTEELRGRAQEITDRILGSPDGRLPYDLHLGGPEIGWRGGGEPPRGALGAREFNIPDAMIAKFLEDDVEQVVAMHLRTMVPDVLLTERFGDVRMTEPLKRIQEDYSARIDTTKSESDRNRLGHERDAVIRDVAAVRDRVRGVYGFAPELRNMARVAAGAKAVNNLTSMGVAAVSSLPDFAGAVFRHGLATTFRDGWTPFVRGLMGSEAWDKHRTQMRALGIGVETAINARQHALDDVMDVYRPGSRFERALQGASDKFFVANLLAPLTDAQKLIASHVAVSEILRASRAVAERRATRRQLANLAEGGIDQQMAGRIWQQFQTGGEVTDGVHLPNTADWRDRSAAGALNSAVARETDIAVVTPGQEKPLWMSHPVMSVLGQFKAFTAAATERILVANLQRRDANSLSGLMFALGLGVMSYKLNSFFGGQKTSDRPQDWVKEGISRGGLLGWFEEGNALASKMTRGGVDVYRLIGADKPLSRFASRSTLDMLLGPTAGKISGLVKVTGAAASGDWGESDTTALRRLFAFQNLFYLRGLLNQVEAGANGALGIETTPRR